MTVERMLRIIAGSFVLITLLLAHFYNGVDLFSGPTWLWFTAFVGFNLLQSGFTNWCPMVDILKKLGFKSSDGACCK